ncbi:putative transcription regulator SWI/SNF-BAF60b family [Helianthus debilis subsp. tardiflorus]
MNILVLSILLSETFLSASMNIIVLNPTNKKEIICDEKLKTIFDGKDRVGFLEIAKLLAPHFVKTA